MEAPGSSNDTLKLGGFRRCTPKVKKLLVVASIASVLLEAMSSALLEDNRFFLRDAELRDGFCKLRRISCLPD